MNWFHRAVRQRFEERRGSKSNTWSSWVRKIVLLLAVLFIIRYFSGEKLARVYNIMFPASDPESMEDISSGNGIHPEENRETSQTDRTGNQAIQKE